MENGIANLCFLTSNFQKMFSKRMEDKSYMKKNLYITIALTLFSVFVLLGANTVNADTWSNVSGEIFYRVPGSQN